MNSGESILMGRSTRNEPCQSGILCRHAVTIILDNEHAARMQEQFRAKITGELDVDDITVTYSNTQDHDLAAISIVDTFALNLNPFPRLAPLICFRRGKFEEVVCFNSI